jgi:flavodoxin/predicted small lipoprotein YifL
MKKGISIILVIAAVLTLVSCGSTSPAQAAPPAIETSTVTYDASAESKTPAEEKGVDQFAESDENRILIAYFSPANSDSVDAVSGATPRVGEISSVEYIAQLIDGQFEADMARIIPMDPYPVIYEDTADRAKSEQDQDERPAFQLDVNPEDYDVIFVGYPVWWYHLPMIMQTFFDSYDFSGKTLIPFNTHAGSRDGGTYREIAALAPGAKVLDGLAIAGEQASEAESTVRNWLTELEF